MPEDSVKASLLLRVIAKMLDFIIMAAAAKTLPQVGYLAGIIYLLISDGLFDGRSLGKKILRLKVISLSTGSSGTFRDSILRNTTLAVALLLYKIPLVGWLFVIVIIALEFLLMLGNKDGMRLGDDIANTEVIEG
ncbi:MAG: RDD family protein [Nitrospiraceae bacterium]|nr:RDD family protein [Nitrospirota bacterium]MDA8215337.1 RDD family protein [Nitrospiraceae bacterium]MDA8339294.1 RDD family protein [Nitrospiraceae bacterium]